jgi:methylphosphotriester-DNA--protein-cysteine methyltransferase
MTSSCYQSCSGCSREIDNTQHVVRDKTGVYALFTPSLIKSARRKNVNFYCEATEDVSTPRVFRCQLSQLSSRHKEITHSVSAITLSRPFAEQNKK